MPITLPVLVQFSLRHQSFSILWLGEKQKHKITMSKTFITNSKKETQKLARDFAKTIKAGDVIALFGDLGSGKTTFAQGLASGLGIKKKVMSPTFIFMRSYPIVLHKIPVTLHHLDLYRGQDEKDFKSLGLNEIFTQDSIVVLEWADRIKRILPKKRIDIFFEIKNEQKRKIKIQTN